jgi:hypothetical protein
MKIKIVICVFLIIIIFIVSIFLFWKEEFESSIDNTEIKPLAPTKYIYPFKNIKQFKPSSCSIQPYDSQDPNKLYIMNIRYINYSFDDEGVIYYHSPDTIGKTKNVAVFLNSSYKPSGQPMIMKEDYINYPAEYEGLEDIRLFYHQNQLKCIACCANIINNGKFNKGGKVIIVMVVGDYNVQNNLITNLKVIGSPYRLTIEKNWIFVNDQYVSRLENSENRKGKMNFIYEWNPLKIGYANENDKLQIYKEYDVPELFKLFRGSTIVIEYDGSLFCVVHYLKNKKPRIYHHCLVQFEYGTLKPIAITNPFIFMNKGVEYCIGFDIKDNIAYFIFSTDDSVPSLIETPMKTFTLNKI